MKVILNCTNLIGDSLYLLRPVKMFLEQFPDQCVAIIVDRGFAFEMFFNTFIKGGMFELIIFDNQEQAINCFPNAQVLNIGAGQSGDICFQESRKPGGRQLHISEGYARILGVSLDSVIPINDWQRVDTASKLLDPFILISPFSRSCSSHSGQPANKTLDDWKIEHIIRSLRKQQLPIKILGGPNDYLKKCSVSVNDYICCDSLYELELTLKSAKLLVTLDNGIGHVAASLYRPMIYLWPKVSSVQFIAPLYNPNAKYLMMTPTEASPVAMFVGFRKFARELLELSEEEIPEINDEEASKKSQT